MDIHKTKTKNLNTIYFLSIHLLSFQITNTLNLNQQHQITKQYEDNSLTKNNVRSTINYL